ncbi:molybdopterin-guanine dinucleotide biosynthesis protein B [Halanaerobaculum tunisiense]
MLGDHTLKTRMKYETRLVREKTTDRNAVLTQSQAGAETVILSSEEKLAVIKELEEEVIVEKLVDKYIDSEFDLVIVEGYKTGSLPKI